MFSPELKYEIAEKVQKILQKTKHPELPTGEITFLLHIDGATSESWANINNNWTPLKTKIPDSLVRNLSV